MATFKQLRWLRTIPQIGGRLYDFGKSVQDSLTAIETQGNFNTTGQPQPPPNIQGLKVTASNGHFHAEIADQSEGLKRGANYGLQYDTSNAFTNPITVHLGPNRNWDKFFGDATLHFRGFSYYDSSSISQHVYHGSQTAPTPVRGGGTIPGAVLGASRGTGTGSEGVNDGGPGPIPVRTKTSGFNWTRQRAQGSRGGFAGTSTPAGIGASGSGGSGGGGGGGGLVPTEAIIASCETLSSIAGTGNAITGVTATSYSALAIGFLLRYVPIHDNSGATTLNVNSIGAKAVTKNGTGAMAGGELVTGRAYLLLYDGTQFQLAGEVAPISATVLASDTHGVPSVAALPDTHIWIGSGGNLPVDKAVSGDATLADTGALTLATVNASPGTFGDATDVAAVTVDAKGRVTGAVNIPIAFPVPAGTYTGTITGTADLVTGAVTGTCTITLP